ncbi:Vacuolar protein-sorting-associated protein 27 [Boothiomyces sp. JEL0838]|nr:Vacuolar protein-sorting-associated protein 27 [Boothiomyces sp. JEL0838]
MNLFANPADEDIEKATSENLPIGTEDLATNLDIADKIKSGKITPKNYVASIKKRINHKNPNVTLLALKLTDTCVKNSGKLLLQEVTSRDFIDNLVSLVRQLNTHEQIRKKALELIQTWAVAFKGRSEFVIVCETYDMLKREGLQFPPIEKTNSLAVLFETTTAPEWTDSSYCMRCRTDFTTFNRKHHCRNCGSTFCQDCSSKSIPLPLLGITDPVRVCDTCHYKITTKTGEVVTPVKLNKPARVDSDDDEDLAKAIAESLELAKKSTSLPRPREEKPKAKSKEDEDLERAIQESLREAERQERMRPKPVQESRYEEPKEEAKLGGLTESQIESVRVFCDLVEKADRDVQQGGFGILNPIPLQTMFAKVASLHRPLVDSLSEAADKYKALYDLNTELTSVIKDYDVLLQQRLQYSQSVSGGYVSNPNPQYGYNPYGKKKLSLGGYPAAGNFPPANPAQPYGAYSGPVNNPYPAGGPNQQQYPPQSVYSANNPSSYPMQPGNTQSSGNSAPSQHFSPSQPGATTQFGQSPPPNQPSNTQAQPPNSQYVPSQPPNAQYAPSEPPNSQYTSYQPPNSQLGPSQPPNTEYGQPNSQYPPNQYTNYPPQPGQYSDTPSHPYNPNGPQYQAYPSQPGYNQNVPQNQPQQPSSPAKPQEAPLIEL